MKQLSEKELIDIVTKSFEAERTGDVDLGERLVADDFKRRDMIVENGTVFPVVSNQDVKVEMNKAYKVKGREFHVWRIAANKESQTVFVELAEVDPSNGKTKIWPYALVCEIENGKIRRSRHYGDPAFLDLDISVGEVKKAVEE